MRQRIKEELGQLKRVRVGLAEYLLHKRERERERKEDVLVRWNIFYSKGTVENSGRVGLMEYLIQER